LLKPDWRLIRYFVSFFLFLISFAAFCRNSVRAADFAINFTAASVQYFYVFFIFACMAGIVLSVDLNYFYNSEKRLGRSLNADAIL